MLELISLAAMYIFIAVVSIFILVFYQEIKDVARSCRRKSKELKYLVRADVCPNCMTGCAPGIIIPSLPCRKTLYHSMWKIKAHVNILLNEIVATIFRV